MTIREWLQGLTEKNSSTEEDSASMQKYLRMIGYSKARCLIGVVYLEGRGQPIDIHSCAQQILKAF